MKIRDAVQYGANRLAIRSDLSDEGRLISEKLLQGILDCRRSELYLDVDKTLQPREKDFFYQGIEKRLEDVPIQYIIGECEFYGLPFKVAPDCLIPRPETELLIDRAKELLEGLQTAELELLDAGTGSGNIAVTLAHLFAKATVDAMDVSMEAINIAKFNAERYAVQDRIQFLHQSFLLEWPNKTYDAVLSNPPYLSEQEYLDAPPEVRKEPRQALTPGVTGLEAYEGLIVRAFLALKESGFILIECGSGQGLALSRLAEKAGFKRIQVQRDYNGHDRILEAWKNL